MHPEIGATELLVIAAVALIVVGPKDLPVLMRKVGQWVAKMRGLAAEFRSSFDELARQSELDELRKEVEALRNTRIPDPLTNLHPTFDEVSAGLDPSGFSIAHDYHPSDLPNIAEPHSQPATVEETAPAKPAPRSPRKPKAAAAGETAPPAKPRRAAKPKTAEAKPRARRASGSAETKG
jgi:sec-independent protein translocase protein TatB